MQSILPVGSIIHNRYIVDGLLGKGGFGAVYLVRDQRVKGNLYALKELIDSNQQERIRFTFEGEVLKRLDHPALPRVYQAFEDEKNARVSMLMDYIDGPNLEALRQQQPGKRFPLADVLRMMGPIFNAVSYLHSQQPPIIHRDIKPSNIIVPAEDDQAMLVDFGIAKEYDPDSTTTAIRRCSPGYGAPEQYSSGTNTRTDIYGLASTMYALLSGEIPADAFYRMTQAGSRGIDTLAPLSDLVPTLPRSVAMAIQKAMALNSADRYQTVEEFWQALHGYPGGGEMSDPVFMYDNLRGLAPTPPMAGGNAAALSMPPPAARGQHNEQVTTRIIAVQSQTNAHKRRGLWLLLPLLALLLVGGAVMSAFWPAIFGHHGTLPGLTPVIAQHPHPTATARTTVAPTPTSTATAGVTPTPTATSAPGLSLSGTHAGQVHNIPSGRSTGMTLDITQQDAHSIQGNVVIRPPLEGSGPIIYSSLNNTTISFTVRGYHGNNPLYFYGAVNNDGSMSGSYCSVDSKTQQCSNYAGGYGTWNVGPASSSSHASLFPWAAYVQAFGQTALLAAQRG